MKYPFNLLLFLTILILGSCDSSHHFNGRYIGNSGVSSEEVIFAQQPNKFNYYLRSEMGILSYSTGNWVEKKNQVIMNGFTKTNVKELKIEENETLGNTDNKDVITIKFSRTDPLIKANISINDEDPILLLGDTTLVSNLKIMTIQFKSYLSYTGILSSPPKIDTLYSLKIEANNSEPKIIRIKLEISPEDFVREVLTDTVVVKNRKTLLWHNLKLIKSG